jgi:pimeloyl-ACP methyl ester carboxylesterase
MKLLGLVVLILLGGLVALTLWRAQAREARALRDTPPTGQFVLVDGLRVHVQVAGTGPDLVLIHGASGNLRDFTFGLMDRLTPHYRVLAFDRPGLGYSDPLPGNETSLAAQAAVLHAAADQLEATKPLLVGQSYGGSVAMAWALDYPAAALVTISAPSLPWPGGLDLWYRLTETAFGRAVIVPLAAAWVPESYVAGTIDAVFLPQEAPPDYLAHLGLDLTLKQSALSTNVMQVNALRSHIVAMEPRLTSLTLPIEMVHGDADTIVPLSIHSRPLSERLPNAHLVVLPGVGHMPHHTNPDAVLDAIDRAATRAGLR